MKFKNHNVAKVPGKNILIARSFERMKFNEFKLDGEY
jgi:hypothetical protein